MSAATRVTKVVGAPAELSEPITAGLRNNGAVQAIDGVDATAVVWFAPEPDGRDFFDLELREWRGQTSDALFAGFDAVQSRLAAMRAAGSGRAVFVVRCDEGQSVQASAVVSGVVTMMRSLARAIGGDGVTVNTVLVNSGTSADAIAETIGYLCSDLAGCVTGQVVEIGGSVGER